MELLTFKIKPLSAFATIPKGDTIFGQIVAYDFLSGGKIFENYLTEKPKLIVSDMMPFGYVYKPNFPLEFFKAPHESEADKKEIRKRNFITIQNIQEGNFYKCEKVDFEKKVSVIRNSINRMTFTTDGEAFAPYGDEERVYTRELWMFVLVEENIKDRVLELITRVGKYGFGKNANIGKGHFKVEQIETPKIDLNSSYYMSLSPTILEGQGFKNVWYEPFTRFGRFGFDKGDGNVFKKTVLMADSGAVIKSTKSIPYFGVSRNNGFDTKVSFLQGYSIALPIKLEDEKCLNIK